MSCQVVGLATKHVCELALFTSIANDYLSSPRKPRSNAGPLPGSESV